jgi:hypothetical protein
MIRFLFAALPIWEREKVTRSTKVHGKNSGKSLQRHSSAKLGTHEARKRATQPEYKAYMALAVAIGEADKAFNALDESLKYPLARVPRGRFFRPYARSRPKGASLTL